MNQPSPTASAERILVVDDDRKIVDLVAMYLRKEGFEAVAAYDGGTALELARISPPALAILDLMLPGVNGLVVCKTLQREHRTPVIMLTARSTEEDRLRGFDLGADDYVVKPFSPRELMSRVRAVLRRASPANVEPAPTAVEAGPLRLDPHAFTVTVAGTPVELTPTEFRVLLAFARVPGQVLTRLQLLDQAFDLGFDGYERNIDVHVMNVRRKLGATGTTRAVLRTIYGVGYRLEVQP